MIEPIVFLVTCQTLAASHKQLEVGILSLDQMGWIWSHFNTKCVTWMDVHGYKIVEELRCDSARLQPGRSIDLLREPTCRTSSWFGLSPSAPSGRARPERSCSC